MRTRPLTVFTVIALAAAGAVASIVIGQPAPAQVAMAPASSPPKPAHTERIAAVDRKVRSIPRNDRNLPNFGVVVPGVYRGAAPTAEGLRRLKEMGVCTVIDLRIEKRGQTEEAAAAKQLGLNRLRLPMGREAPTTKQVATFLGTLGDPAKRPVFIHCQHGADRTGAMVGIYRVTQQGWTFPQAWTEMRRYGFKTYLHELKASVASRTR